MRGEGGSCIMLAGAAISTSVQKGQGEKEEMRKKHIKIGWEEGHRLIERC